MNLAPLIPYRSLHYRMDGVPIPQTGNQRLREIKPHTQGHRAKKCDMAFFHIAELGCEPIFG